MGGYAPLELPEAAENNARADAAAAAAAAAANPAAAPGAGDLGALDPALVENLLKFSKEAADVAVEVAPKVAQAARETRAARGTAHRGQRRQAPVKESASAPAPAPAPAPKPAPSQPSALGRWGPYLVAGLLVLGAGSLAWGLHARKKAQQRALVDAAA